MTLLENDKIRLRALEPEDLGALYRWENDTEWWGVGSTLTPFSRFALREYIAGSHRDIYDIKQLRLIIELKEQNQAIGMIDLYDYEPYHRRAATGILLDKIYQGNGYGQDAVKLLAEYAFSFLKIHQLYVYVPESNQSSISLYLRCGFTTAGILKDWLEKSGTYENVQVMQLINTCT